MFTKSMRRNVYSAADTATNAELEGSSKVQESQTDVDAVYEKAIDDFSHVNVLVNFHGAMNVGSIAAVAPSKWWGNLVSPDMNRNADKEG
ncbi:hypothetical protein DL765_001431 [Monosporascus sp. GIB2]|nr:hypothetical protein DL765_001431 [Monosporascus sp. GIB2]